LIAKRPIPFLIDCTITKTIMTGEGLDDRPVVYTQYRQIQEFISS
jgi:hypothetical protein